MKNKILALLLAAAVLTALASQLALTDVQVEARPIDEVIAALYRDLRI